MREIDAARGAVDEALAGALPMLKAGRVVPIGVTGAQRAKALPDGQEAIATSSKIIKDVGIKAE